MFAVMLAQIDELGGKLTGLGAQLLAALLGAATLLVSIVVIWKLLASMVGNPSYEKLLAIVGVGLFAVFLVGAAPDALDAAYAYGQSFLDGGE